MQKRRQTGGFSKITTQLVAGHIQPVQTHLLSVFYQL